jgi:antitoxin HicB
MDYVFHARFEPDGDEFLLVTFPDVPEAITQGTGRADARAMAADALAVALRGRLADGDPLPVPAAKGNGLVPIPVDAETALKIAVIEAFVASGISETELKTRIGKSDAEVERILDPDHPTRIGPLKAALDALGKDVIVTVHDAA